jgi:general stress protein 26
MDNQKARILDFIKKQKVCVLSTVTKDNRSESAVIEFGEMDNLEIVFDTIETYRKYDNLLHNRNVSVAIGLDSEVTIQYEGEATELIGDAAKAYKESYWKKNPKAQKWENSPGIKFFRIVPKWIRYADLSKRPWEIFEVSF